MRVVVRTLTGKRCVFRNATARVDSMSTLVIRGSDGKRLAMYRRGEALHFDLRPDCDQRA